MATRLERLAFINKYLPQALKVCEDNGYNFALACTCISQSALETGWGVCGGIMIKSNALHGIKGVYKKDGKEYFYESPTREWVNGKYVTITCKFRAYPTIQDGFEDYFNTVLKQSNFKNVFLMDNVKDCVTVLKNGGYATDPNYIKSVCSVWSTIANDLKGNI